MTRFSLRIKLNTRRPVAYLATTLLAVFALMCAAALAQAQTFTVIHSFTGHQDGAAPYAGLTADRFENLYGTTSAGGYFYCYSDGCGGVYKLKRSGAGWLFTPMYNFEEGGGIYPQAPVSIGPDGSVFGTTTQGGQTLCGVTGCGIVFNVRPSPTVCTSALCPGVLNTLTSFRGGSDGAYPYAGVTFDEAGNLYGTTSEGGSGNCPPDGCGVVYKMTHSQSGWSESVLYTFASTAYPGSGVVVGHNGELYGSLQDDSTRYGSVFQLTQVGGIWVKTTLYTFTGGSDGGWPGQLISDSAGNLYGTTTYASGQGTVFKLTNTGGSWSFTTLYSFTDAGAAGQFLTMDSAGNLYGTKPLGGTHGAGAVFKLSFSNGQWNETVLHDFSGGDDGMQPYGGVTVDAAGNLYGTTVQGGAQNDGVVYQITP